MLLLKSQEIQETFTNIFVTLLPVLGTPGAVIATRLSDTAAR